MTKEETFECVGPGWRDILDRLYDDLIALGWDGNIAQVKEKFGGLRYYIGPVPKEIFDAVYTRIQQAELESDETCEECGKPGTIGTILWLLKCVCDDCFERLLAERKKRVPRV